MVDEFVAAVLSRWPRAVLQFEDFSIEHARPLLDRYRKEHLVFNDDIQARCSCFAPHHLCNELCTQNSRTPACITAGTLLYVLFKMAGNVKTRMRCTCQ